jgi:hypothetical protein
VASATDKYGKSDMWGQVSGETSFCSEIDSWIVVYLVRLMDQQLFVCEVNGLTI